MAEMRSEVLDITGEPPSRVPGAAFQAVRDLQPGQCIVLLTLEEPSLLMHSLDLQAGHKLAWSVSEEVGRWRTVVRHRADVGPSDVLDLLQREHQRLDRLLARAVRLLDSGDAAGATPLLLEFIHTLMRHLYVEDEVLTPFFGAEATADDAAAIMRREHAQIAGQLELIGDCLRQSGAADASAYCAILSGTLAKHEHREEQNVFPRWRALLARRRPAEGAALLERVRGLLAG